MTHTPKTKTFVEIRRITHGRFPDIARGSIFLDPDQRLSDLMNDRNEFIPVELSDGVSVIAKSTIAEIREVEPAG